MDEVGEHYAMVTLNKVRDNGFLQCAEDISQCLSTIKNKVEDLIRTYSRTFRVDFEIESASVLTPTEQRLTTDINETLLVKVSCLLTQNIGV